jgi:hypothetical protein
MILEQYGRWTMSALAWMRQLRLEIGKSIVSGLRALWASLCFYDRVYPECILLSQEGNNGKTHSSEEKG